MGVLFLNCRFENNRDKTLTYGIVEEELGGDRTNYSATNQERGRHLLENIS